MNHAFASATDAAAAEWVVANLRGFGEGVGSIIPARFESYARVFHPAWYGPPGSRPVRWEDVAAANGRVMHPAAEWGSLTGSLEYIYNGGQPGIWEQPPALGGPPSAVAERLVAVLGNFTGTPADCWFGVSGVWGSRLRAPKFGIEHRRFYLLKGPLISAVFSPHDDDYRGLLADLWWPADRAWFVGSDVDLLSTYIGGTRACISAPLEQQGLEVLSIPLDQGLAWDTDTINPLPPPHPD
jgi:hypothetical protein